MIRHNQQQPMMIVLVYYRVRLFITWNFVFVQYFIVEALT